MEYQFFSMKSILREEERIFNEPYHIGHTDSGMVRIKLMRVNEGYMLRHLSEWD